MGVETDYIAAREEDLDAIFSADNPIAMFGGVYGKGTDPVSISSLFFKVKNEEFDASIIDEFEPVRSDDSYEKMILPLPEKIKLFLATINEINVNDVLSKWKETEEYQLTGWDDSIARDFLLQIGQYANQKQDLTLYMWVSV